MCIVGLSKLVNVRTFLEAKILNVEERFKKKKKKRMKEGKKLCRVDWN